MRAHNNISRLIRWTTLTLAIIALGGAYMAYGAEGSRISSYVSQLLRTDNSTRQVNLSANVNSQNDEPIITAGMIEEEFYLPVYPGFSLETPQAANDADYSVSREANIVLDKIYPAEQCPIQKYQNGKIVALSETRGCL